MSDYKYTAKFDVEIFATSINELKVSKASLNKLEPLIPDDIDFKKNPDLMGVSFNAAVVNAFNKNHDGISSETAVEHVDRFIHKPTNIEHNKERVVGHIVTAGFSKYGTNEIMSSEEALKTKTPYNIALGAVIYKQLDFANVLEMSCNPKDKGMYKKISASWEIGFSNYVLAVGSKTLKDATKIIDDPEEIRKMEGMLKCYGGCGVTDAGEPIYRLIVGNIYPLGIGFTTNPAADVEGVYKKDDKKIAKANDNINKISQNSKINVKQKNNNDMDIEKLVSELKEALVEKKFSEEAVATMTSTFNDAIREGNEKYQKEIEAEKSAKEALAKEQEELKASVKELQDKLSEANDKISQFENEKRAEEAVARFSERMEKLDKDFDLEKEDREFLAKEVKDLDETEESFASFCEKLNVLWKHKSKASKEEQEKQFQEKVNREIEERIAKASADGQISIEKLLDKVKPEDKPVPNGDEANASENDSIVDKFKKTFSKDNFVIS